MKEIHRAYRFRVYPNQENLTILNQSMGCARFVYNRILDLSIKNYEAGIKLSPGDRVKLLPQLKQEFDWLKTPSSIYLQQAIIHLNTAYQNFFQGRSGFPQFKKKQERNSITLVGKESIHFDEQGNFTLPKAKSKLDIQFSRDFQRENVSSVTLSKNPSGHFFISFLVKESCPTSDEIHLAQKQKMALDLGIKTIIVAFDGENHQEFNLPQERLVKLNKKIKQQQRILAKKQKKSKNRYKAKIKLARLYETKSNIVENFYHQTSSHLVKHYAEIVTEDLDIQGLKEKKVKKAKGKPNVKTGIQQSAWGKFLNMLRYKTEWYGKRNSQVNRFFPSSKLCSTLNCGYINQKLNLSTREWICPQCGAQHDRDENASKNLFYYQGELNSQIKTAELKNRQKPSRSKNPAFKTLTKDPTEGSSELACGGFELETLQGGQFESSETGIPVL